MEPVLKELHRILQPFPGEVVLAAIRGEPTLYDIDGRWRASPWGSGDLLQPEGEPRAFDGPAMVAGATAVCYLAAQLPVGHPLRGGLPALVERMRARLANPELLLHVGFPRDQQPLPRIEGVPYHPDDRYSDDDGVDSGALVVTRYVYFRPARLARDEDRTILADLTWPVWSSTFPFAGVYGVFRYLCSEDLSAVVRRVADTPVAEGSWEADPRQSAPEVVAQARERHHLSEDGAALYLQLRTLCDCSARWLQVINSWTSPRLKQAGDELVRSGLALAEKRPRAGRPFVLPDFWEQLRAPQPAMERSKLRLYDARFEGDVLAAPLGRIVALRPLHRMFAEAWEAEGEAAGVSPAAGARDWVAEIAAAPEDDALRLVYGDWLSERGDPRGELVAVQCRITAREARQPRLESGPSGQEVREGDEERDELESLREREAELLERHGPAWVGTVQPLVEGWRFDRGFVAGITIKIPTFVKNAALLVDQLPLLRELSIAVGGRLVPDKQVDALAACEALARITRLDFTPEQYLSARAFVRLLRSPHLGRLERLRLGFHAKGSGIGITGARAIAGCSRLDRLRILELPGQRLGDSGAEVLAAAPTLAHLEVLRLPYNDIGDQGAESLLAMPRLRVLDLSNTVETKASTWAIEPRRNRLTAAVEERVRQLSQKR